MVATKGEISSLNPVDLTTEVSGKLPVANAGKDTQPLVNYGGMNFNGTTTYLDTNPLTGIADGKKGTLFCIVRFADTASGVSGSEYIMEGIQGSQEFYFARSDAGTFLIRVLDASDVTALDIRSAVGAMSAAGTYVIMASWDTAVAGSGRVYINDVSSYTETTFVNTDLDYTLTEYSVGRRAGSNSGYLNGDVYSLWFDAASYIDFAVAANRRKFIDVNLVPNFLGNRGELPTGSVPLLFLGYSASDSWSANKGSSTSSFTRNGAIADATTVLYGQYGRYKDITVATTTGAQTINKERGSVLFATSATSLVVTCDKATVNSIITPTVCGTDLTLKSVTITKANGSFTITGNAAATAQTQVDFVIHNG